MCKRREGSSCKGPPAVRPFIRARVITARDRAPPAGRATAKKIRLRRRSALAVLQINARAPSKMRDVQV